MSQQRQLAPVLHYARPSFPAVLLAGPRQSGKQPFCSESLAGRVATVKSWAGVLEASYVAYLLPPWFRNYGKRLVKASKLYFYDAALVNFFTRQPNATAALASPMGGALLEGWVVTEAVKAFLSLGRKPELYFWRSHDGLEVDLLIVINGKLHPVEIKLTATPGAGHVEPINRLLAAAGNEASSSGIIVCRTESERALPNGHVAMPWQLFPQWLGTQLSKATA